MAQSEQKQNGVVVGLRWVAFIPGGIALGALAGVGSLLLLTGMSTRAGFDPDSEMNRLLLLVLANGIAGAATVKSGVLIAPSPAKVIPGAILTGVAVLTGGMGLAFFLVDHDWLKLVQAVCYCGGVASVFFPMLRTDKQPNAT